MLKSTWRMTACSTASRNLVHALSYPARAAPRLRGRFTSICAHACKVWEVWEVAAVGPKCWVNYALLLPSSNRTLEHPVNCTSGSPRSVA